MAQLNFPSMFDTRHAMDRQMQDDAHKAAVAGGGGKRYGMYYNSSLLGDQDIARKRNLLGMFGLGGDPRMQQQQALDDIMARFPNPQTPDDFVEISNALSGAGLHSYAEAAMDMANETRTSMPGPDEIIIKEIKTTDTDGTPVTKTVRFNKTKGVIVEVLSVAPTWEPAEPTEETFTYKSFPSTNAQGQRVDEMWKINSSGERVELMSTQLKDKPVTEKELTLDEQIYEANLAPYVASAKANIQSATSTTGILSEEDMNAQAREQAMRDYSKVQNLAKNQTDGTTFTKNVDFFLAQKGTDGKNLYTLTQAIAQATSLDHKTVSEEDQIAQNAAVLEEEKSMTALELTANDNVRLNSQMLSLLDSIETGAWEDVKFRAARWLGFDDDLPSREMFFSLATAKVMEYTQMTKGAISDAEMQLFQSAAVSMGKTTEGNRMLLMFAQAGAEATKRVAQHMRTWKLEQKANNQKFNYTQFINERERYRNSDENAAYFDVVHSEEWKRAQAMGDAMNTYQNLEAMRKDENSDMYAFCQKWPNTPVCQI
jgi:hypothetical protein